ncbi:hypothetical protein GCM10010123_45730 [Pilimelia anulata]|uniref:Nudix hydrolase domain-containing protein n=1 Tax=Pilimelia anulata TaxID=53371 RepID=A0A8J3FEY3_9ACTN|nr:NUDIX domain-containing protein [Pilimelia anulata]GGK10589.1 hypothetical protein GCM10010123_45730 [Pilimelia anulata]
MLTDPTTSAPAVPQHLRPWRRAYRSYAPVDITPHELRADGGLADSVAAGWAEPAADPTVIDWAPRQAVAGVPFDVVDGVPRHPDGRTGRAGRDLGCWGENAAADAIVIADSPDGPQVLLVRRRDCGDWALPGGMREAGESADVAARRELWEEAGVDLAGVPAAAATTTVVDDPRATDHAWVTTTAILYRLPAAVPVVAGDDAAEARWWPCHDHDRDAFLTLTRAIEHHGGDLYPAHDYLLRRTLGYLQAGAIRPHTEPLTVDELHTMLDELAELPAGEPVHPLPTALVRISWLLGEQTCDGLWTVPDLQQLVHRALHVLAQRDTSC